MDDLNKHVDQQLADELNRSLYGDGMPRPKIGLEYYLGYVGNETCQNVKLTWHLWFVMMWQRVKDAWLVLRGRAEIDGY